MKGQLLIGSRVFKIPNLLCSTPHSIVLPPLVLSLEIRRIWLYESNYFGRRVKNYENLFAFGTGDALSQRRIYPWVRIGSAQSEFRGTNASDVAIQRTF